MGAQDLVREKEGGRPEREGMEQSKNEVSAEVHLAWSGQVWRLNDTQRGSSLEARGLPFLALL